VKKTFLWIVGSVIMFSNIGMSVDNLPCDLGLVVTVTGDKYVKVGATIDYTCEGSPAGGTYAWTHSDGFSLTADEDTATVTAQATPIGDQWVNCEYTVAGTGDEADKVCEGQVDVTIVKVAIVDNNYQGAEDGELVTYTYTIEPAGLGLTPEWSLSPGGGGTGLEPPVLTSTPEDKKVTVMYYWHAGNGEVPPCIYTLELGFEGTELCKDLAVQVSVLQPAGVTDMVAFPVSDCIFSNNLYFVQGMESCITVVNSSDVLLSETSQFYNKIEKHEGVHETDFGPNGDAAAEGYTFCEKYLEDEGYTDGPGLSQIEQMQMDLKLIADVDEYLIGDPGNAVSWGKIRAYMESNQYNPEHLFQR